MSIQDDDTASMKSYGSHKNRPFKDESHKGSAETMEGGEEKRDASKEDLGMDEGELVNRLNLRSLSKLPRCPRAELDEEGDGEEGMGEEEMVIRADDGDVIDDSPSDCCPDPCYKKFPILSGDDDSPFWQGWGNLRLKTFQLIENKYFETAVITMILLSSLALVSWDWRPVIWLDRFVIDVLVVCRPSRTCTCRIDQSCRTSCTTWIEFSP